MKLVNQSGLFIAGSVFSGKPPPTSAAQPVYKTNSSTNIQPDGITVEPPLASGVYWVRFGIGALGNPGPPPIPQGTLVAQTGGVRDTDTVVLTQDLRIAVEA